MKKNYLLLAGLLLGLVPAVKAQYIFKDLPDASVGSGGLAPYEQNFNTLSGAVNFTSNTTLRGVYAEAEFSGSIFNPTTIAPNNGSYAVANYYHFGVTNDTDRSLGGIAATTTANGIGYVGIRFKNSSSKIIKNLEVQYAMEQWYNSGRQDAAFVAVSYLKGATVEGLVNATGTWVAIEDLRVDAPSTATVIASRDGNSPSNRRVRQTTLADINLAVGQEIMIRWAYALNNTTNGNGLSIDDVVVTPQTNVFYSVRSGALDNPDNWGVNANGKGGGVTDFTTDNATYYVQGTGVGNRITKADWTVSGANSKLVVGTAASPALFTIVKAKNFSGRINVSNGSTFSNQRIEDVNFTLGSLGATSTVYYLNPLSSTNPRQQKVLPAEYGNLTLSGTGDIVLSSNVTVNGNLSLDNSAKPMLGDYSLTINKGGAVINSTPTAFVVTDGKGALRQSVANSGADVIFPVGASATSYSPVALRQPNNTTARNEDVFGVRVLDNVYATYDANGTGTTLVNKQSVKKTWLIDEEVPGNSNVTMTLQWNKADETTAPNTFDRSKAYISHYKANAFDKPAVSAAVSGTIADSYKLSRTGIVSFSPFVVSSRPAGVLPVTLLSFGAHRAQQAVMCDWRTAQELNNDHFVVERSLNGTAFVAVGQVSGRGTTSIGQRYQFLDDAAPAGLAYYRLRQVDTDGTATYSDVVTVAAGASAALVAVTPNPGTGSYQLIAPATSRPAEVFNVLGSLVQTVAADGRIDLRAQPGGVYLVRLYLPDGSRTIRIIKE